MNRRRTILAAAVIGALSVTVTAHAEDGGVTLVSTGDVDLLEDVFEHASLPDGPGSRTVHQMYDSRSDAAD